VSSFYLRQQRADRASFLLGYVSAAKRRERPRLPRSHDLDDERSLDWLKMKNPEAPAVKREAEEDWGR
jgi:hypothetical protein